MWRVTIETDGYGFQDRYFNADEEERAKNLYYAAEALRACGVGGILTIRLDCLMVGISRTSTVWVTDREC